MSILIPVFISILAFVHVLGAAAIFGGWLANFKTPTVTNWQWIGALVQLITGLLMVGLFEMNAPEEGLGATFHAKIGVKAVIAIIVVVAAFIGRKKVKAGEDVSKGLAHAVGGMTFINIAVAVLWS